MMTSSTGEAQASARHDKHSPFFDPLPYDWEDSGTRTCICPSCARTYYRRISISPTKIVHSERTHCDCTWTKYMRERDIEQQAVFLWNDSTLLKGITD